MIILVTGAKGFAGRNLVENLKNIRDGKNKTRPNITIEEIYEYDIDSTPAELDEYCAKADFVFHLAGVNRPTDPADFKKGNRDLAELLLSTLKKHNSKAPVMVSSSIQATLAGRFGTSEYGLSKRAGEELFFAYGEETGNHVMVYRFPNLVGKWVRPNYNSAVGTFCNNIANDLPITVNDPSVELEMLFIDDLVEEITETKHIDTADSDRITQTKFVKLIQVIIQSEIIHFIDNKQDRLSGLSQKIGNFLVVFRQPIPGISKKADYICEFDGCRGLFTHLTEKLVIALRVDSACIDQRELSAEPFSIRCDPVPCYTGYIFHNADPFTGDFVEKS